VRCVFFNYSFFPARGPPLSDRYSYTMFMTSAVLYTSPRFRFSVCPPVLMYDFVNRAKNFDKTYAILHDARTVTHSYRFDASRDVIDVTIHYSYESFGRALSSVRLPSERNEQTFFPPRNYSNIENITHNFWTVKRDKLLRAHNAYNGYART